ncbi:MAG: RidA family protein [Gemmatimonadota bacterium]
MRAIRRSLPVVLTLLLPLVAGCATGSGGADAAPLKEILNPAGGPVTTPYSPGVRSGNLLFLSGVIGRGEIGPATRQALEGVQERLTAAGLTMADAVKCTVFMIDMADYGGMNEVYAQFFTADPPARSAIAVQALPANARVEIECIAAVR